MSSIDKTYTNSYKDYKEFKDWANMQIVTFFDGYKKCIGDWVRDYEEADFNNSEIPIMNTPTWLDIYLIQNCKSKFVLDRMKSVYGEDNYDKFQAINLSAKPPKDFQQNRKISIVRNEKTKFPLHSKSFGGCKWWLHSNNNFQYNDETKTWSSRDSYYPYYTNTASITSIKALVRHLRKQYLPKNISFTLIGNYVGEIYSVYIN